MHSAVGAANTLAYIRGKFDGPASSSPWDWVYSTRGARHKAHQQGADSIVPGNNWATLVKGLADRLIIWRESDC